ncbi:MAG: polysaccharide biosynthesis C-terminal domain-containing protein [Bacteroidia bacterium]
MLDKCFAIKVFPNIFSTSVNAKNLLSFALQMIGMALSFLLSVVVVNYFGEKVYGDYTLAFSIIELLGVFAMLGFNQFFLIHIPKLLDNPSKITAIYTSGKKTVVFTSVLFGLILFGISFLDLPYFKSDTARFFFRFGALTMPLFAFGNLQSSFLNSIKLSNLSQWNDKLIKPVVLIVLVLVLALAGLQSEWLLYAYIISVLAGVMLNFRFVSKHFSFAKSVDISDELANKKRALTLIVIISFITLIASKTDMYMLGWISGSEYSGLYNVYFKLSGLVSIGLSSSLVIIMPILSEKLSKFELKEARQMLKSSSRLTLTMGILAFAGIFLIAPYFLKIYKSDIFQSNITALYIFCFASLVNLLSGPSGALLTAGNKLKLLVLAHSTALVVNVALNIWLIPSFGIEGAAWATLASQIYINVLLYIFCIKYLQLNPTAFGK